MKTNFRTLRSFSILIKCICLVLLPSLVLSQETVPGKLYIKVIDPAGIPTITITDIDTIVDMENTTLETLYQQAGVYQFSRAFPLVDGLAPYC